MTNERGNEVDIDLTLSLHDDLLRTTPERARRHVEEHIDVMPKTAEGILALDASLKAASEALPPRQRERFRVFSGLVIKELTARLPDDEEGAEHP